jgi:hypothetical protein
MSGFTSGDDLESFSTIRVLPIGGMTLKFSCNRINKSARRSRAPSLARLSVATFVIRLVREA